MKIQISEIQYFFYGRNVSEAEIQNNHSYKNWLAQFCRKCSINDKNTVENDKEYHTVRLMHCQDLIPHRLAEVVSEEPATSRLSFWIASTYRLSSHICWYRIHPNFCFFLCEFSYDSTLWTTSSSTAWPYQIWRLLDATVMVQSLALSLSLRVLPTEVHSKTLCCCYKINMLHASAESKIYVNRSSVFLFHHF